MAVQWIKDVEGGLVNLRYVCALYMRWRGALHDPEYEVVADLAGGGSIRLYTGPEDECERYIANLAQQLEVIG